MSYLTSYQIEQLRQSIDWDKWPLSSKEWPSRLVESTNCLAFALGLPFPDADRFIFTPTFLKSFISELLLELGFEYRELKSSKKARSDEVVIECFENLGSNGSFHVIRRNCDGTWVHKEGWYEAPTEIVFNGYFDCMYPPESLSFILAVKKKAS